MRPQAFALLKYIKRTKFKAAVRLKTGKVNMWAGGKATEVRWWKAGRELAPESTHLLCCCAGVWGRGGDCYRAWCAGRGYTGALRCGACLLRSFLGLGVQAPLGLIAFDVVFVPWSYFSLSSFLKVCLTFSTLTCMNDGLLWEASNKMSILVHTKHLFQYWHVPDQKMFLRLEVGER